MPEQQAATTGHDQTTVAIASCNRAAHALRACAVDVGIGDALGLHQGFTRLAAEFEDLARTIDAGGSSPSGAARCRLRLVR